ARHGAEMDALRRGAALDIGDVACERLLEMRPGSRPIRPREEPGMHDPAQGGAVRCPLRVVIDDPRYRLMPEGIAEAAEEGPEFDGRVQVEEHQRIGLFRGLVVIDAVPFRLEDPVEALDVAVFLPVAFPVELVEALVALELADDAVVEGDEELAADPVPERDFLVPERKILPDLGPPLR